MLISVDPREEAGDVVELRERYYRLIELDLATCDEFALEDSVIDFLVKGSLGLREAGRGLMPFEDNIKISHQFAI